MTARLRASGLRSSLAGPFDLELNAGECLAVTGPSGSGKSLLLRMLADLDPHEGEAWLDGRPRAAMPAPSWRAQVTLSAAEPGWWHDRVGDHFRAPPPDLARLALPPHILDRPVAACSTGERARLGLLRSLAGNPLVLLADEPTGAHDQAATAAVEALLAERLRAGLTLLLVTHDPAQAAKLGAQHAHVAHGRMTQGRMLPA